VLVDGRSGRSVQCMIIDLSAGGARLRLQDPNIPDQGLTLIDRVHKTLNDCGVVWRKEGFVGVKFSPPPESAATKAQLRLLSGGTSQDA
jgi:hypothetical protein